MSGRIERRLGLLALAGLAAALGACGSSSASEASTDFEPLLSASIPAPLIEVLAAGPTAVAHYGVRQVELFDYDEAGHASTVVYREVVAVDDSGRFSLDPLDALTPVEPDEPTFLALQSARSGYHFRYRDFRIRDIGAFLANFTLAVDDLQPVSLLGRACTRVDVDSIGDKGLDYDLLLDDSTGVVLASQVIDAADGRLLQRNTFLSFAEGVPMGFQPHQPTNQEQPLDLGAPLAPQLGVPAGLPTYLPDGYLLSDASTVVDPEGLRWLLLTCTDGVEALFLLERLGPVGPIGHGGVAVHADPGSVDAPEGDELYGFQAGRITVLQGRLSGHFCAAVGSASPLDLQLTLESTVF